MIRVFTHPVSVIIVIFLAGFASGCSSSPSLDVAQSELDRLLREGSYECVGSELVGEYSRGSNVHDFIFRVECVQETELSEKRLDYRYHRLSFIRFPGGWRYETHTEISNWSGPRHGSDQGISIGPVSWWNSGALLGIGIPFLLVLVVVVLRLLDRSGSAFKVVPDRIKLRWQAKLNFRQDRFRSNIPGDTDQDEPSEPTEIKRWP